MWHKFNKKHKNKETTKKQESLSGFYGNMTAKFCVASPFPVNETLPQLQFRKNLFCLTVTQGVMDQFLHL